MVVVGVTGASGAPYAVRLVEQLVRAGRRVECAVTPAGRLVLADELDAGPPDAAAPDALPEAAALWPAEVARQVTLRAAEDLVAPPASGSLRAEATVVCPCSMNTAAAVAAGLAMNLVQRAAQVALKEGRPLVLVPRETPVTATDLQNLARLARLGAAVVPASPAFYHRPETVADLVDFVVAKVLDRLGLDHALRTRWPPCQDA